MTDGMGGAGEPEASDSLKAFGEVVKAFRKRAGLASWFRQWARFEAEAVSLYTYECRLIPVLLQTEAYARTLPCSGGSMAR